MSSLADWLFVTNGAVPSGELVDDALRSAPIGVLEGGVLLPRRRPEHAACRICGRTDNLSREHIPPRSAGNDQTSRSHGIVEWLERDALGDLPGGAVEQNGVFGFVLCRACNSITGRHYGEEYRRFAAISSRLFIEELPSVDELDRRTITPRVKIRYLEAHPARFARQVLSLMISLAGPWGLAANFPQLKGTLLEGSPCKLPAPLTLEVGLCGPVAARWAGPSLVLDLEKGTWRWLVSLAFPPFAFELTLAQSAGQHDESVHCHIGHFLSYPNDMQCDVELDMIVGFAHTPFPTDWRTRAQIENNLDLYGNPNSEQASTQ